MNLVIPQSSRKVRFSGRATICLIATLLLHGCAINSDKIPRGVPAEAKLITEQSGRLIFNVPDAGAVYIYNENKRKVIYKSPVKYRDKLLFYPETHRVILNGTVVREDQNLDGNHVHRLYFVKG